MTLAVLRPRMNPVSQPSLSRVQFTLPSISELANGSEIPPNPVEISCSKAEPEPFPLLSWGFAANAADSVDAGDGLPVPSKGVIMGCNDGTLYVFLPTRQEQPKLAYAHPVPVVPPSSSRPNSVFRLSRHSRAGSRSDPISSL